MLDATDTIPFLIPEVLEAKSKSVPIDLERKKRLEEEHNDIYNAMLENLVENDRFLLRQAAIIREQALGRLRSGDLKVGSDILNEVRKERMSKLSSEEARIQAEPFQLLAQAYLHYRRSEFEIAKKLIIEALTICNSLESNYGYSLEVHRIHFARNFIRLMTAAGETRASIEKVRLLIGYVSGKPSEWPLKEVGVPRNPRPLKKDEQWMMIDQALSEISFILRAGFKESISKTNELTFERVDLRKFPLARIWTKAKIAYANDNILEFLLLAKVFYTKSEGNLPIAWADLSKDVIQIFDLYKKTK